MSPDDPQLRPIRPASPDEVIDEVGRDFPVDDVWRRLSPRMLLVHPVREVIRFLPVLIGLLIAGSAGGGDNWWSLIATGVAILLGLLRWFTTAYRFDDDQLQLRHGLINKQTVSAPMDRIRSVDVTATVMHRVLGLAEVKIGTGAGESELKLDGLSAGQAAALRADLLHRHTGGGASADTGGPAAVGRPSPEPGTMQPIALAKKPAEDTLYELRPAWIRYAPFNPTGLIAALAALAIVVQAISQSGIDISHNSEVRSGWQHVEDWGLALLITSGVIAALVLVVVLAVGGYVLSFWGFRLTHHRAGGTFHISRGLLTTRATSLERRRMRGVDLAESVPLRWVGGATLRAITTGVKDDDRGMSALLAPPSPAPVVRMVGDRVLETPGVFGAALTSHGPAATRRRYTRAVVPGLLVAVAVVVAAGLWWPRPLALLAVLPLIAAVALGRSRSHALGHAVTPRFLVARSGGMARHTRVVAREGAVAVSLRRSFMQRRAGVTTVQLATAAGHQGYDVVDVPADGAADLAEQILPGYVAQFRE